MITLLLVIRFLAFWVKNSTFWDQVCNHKSAHIDFGVLRLLLSAVPETQRAFGASAGVCIVESAVHAEGGVKGSIRKGQGASVERRSRCDPGAIDED